MQSYDAKHIQSLGFILFLVFAMHIYSTLDYKNAHSLQYYQNKLMQFIKMQWGFFINDTATFLPLQ